jgi:hypothetical protein
VAPDKINVSRPQQAVRLIVATQKGVDASTQRNVVAAGRAEIRLPLLRGGELDGGQEDGPDLLEIENGRFSQCKSRRRLPF